MARLGVLIIRKNALSSSGLIMTRTKVIAFRDKYGVMPLSIATLETKLGPGYLVASEDSAFRIFPGYKFVREVNPGEMVIFDKKSIRDGNGFKSIQFAEPDEHYCSFSPVYFEGPRSTKNGYMHEDFREESGVRVFEENREFFEKLKANIGASYKDKVAVVPILDSGKHGALGFSRASDIPYKEYFLRRHNNPKSKGRAYTAASQRERESIAYGKLDLRPEKIKGKIIVSVDDSNVRGTTATLSL